MLVTGTYPPRPCGVGDHVQRLACELAKHGHQTWVVTSSVGVELAGSESDGNVQILREVTKWDFSSYETILDSIRRHKTEIVHVHYSPHSFELHPTITLLPWLLKRHVRSQSLRTVVTLHELGGPASVFLPGPARRLWLLPLLRSSDAAIVTNERYLSVLRVVPGLQSKLRYIPLAPTIEPIHEVNKNSVRRSLGVVNGEMLVARFGLVHDSHANCLPQMILAIKRLRTKGHRVKLLLVGGGNEIDRKELASLAHSNGIGDSIIFSGFCLPSDVSRYLLSADIAAQCCPEGVSEKRTGLLTAMAHGLAVVGQGKGHIASMFIHRENILLASSSGPGAIAEAIEELIVDVNLRGKLGQNAIKTAASFNWDRIRMATGEVYESLLQRPPRRSCIF